jgi:hypothetical protein
MDVYISVPFMHMKQIRHMGEFVHVCLPAYMPARMFQLEDRWKDYDYILYGSYDIPAAQKG